MTPPARGARRAGSYWEASRAHRYSLLFALPLLLVYEALAALLAADPSAAGVRNGADVLLKSLFIAAAGRRGPLLFMAVVIGISLWLIRRDLRANGGRLRAWIFGGMVVESLVLSLAFGVVVGALTVRILGPLGALAVQVGGEVQTMSWPARFMLSIGAGLYEELLFRVVVVSAIANGARLAFGWGRGGAGVIATILGALIFSAFHYVGPYGDEFALQSFTFRAIAGLMFSALYLTRGFGITAWTHAMYDVFVLLVWE
ncbi:MAG: CPBP family intramembrane metalloprotease [Gemmatimonadota bacterium]|nr:CPBP family intramembrane metalloprotease [Gemmatimonadota bacterium]